MSLELAMIPQSPEQLSLKDRLINAHDKVLEFNTKEFTPLIEYLTLFATLGLKSAFHKAVGIELPFTEVQKVMLELNYKDLSHPTEETFHAISKRTKEISRKRINYHKKLYSIQEYHQVSGLTLQRFHFVNGAYTLAPGWNADSGLIVIESDLNILNHWKEILVDLWIDSIKNYQIYLWTYDSNCEYKPISMTEFRAYVAIAKWADPYLYYDEFATISIGTTTDMESLGSVTTFSAIPPSMSINELPI